MASIPIRWGRQALAALLLVLLAVAYWPGLSGPFLFDDFSNLDDLGAFGPLDNWDAFLFYATAGTADPTGRPLAQLSFLLDAQDWPADPRPFKRTNLALHLLNTVLLWAAVARMQAGLLRRQPRAAVSDATPLLAAALWGAHPFFVSTTLYVVQREAMLPLSFVLLALLAWDRAMRHFSQGRDGAGWFWATVVFGGCTVLAGLSKANGFLAPLLAGLCHLWFLRPRDATARRGADLAALACLALPSAMIFAYLVRYGITRWDMAYLQGRDWTLPERLLSQPRALWDYVGHLALPRAGGGGLFVEDFQASRSWTSPATTLPAATALLASIVAAIAWRRRFPVASFAWLFFLAAHLLESSVVALELYFEHRNYLPAAFLAWPVAHALLRPGAYPGYRACLAGLLLAACLLLTHQRATTWGDPALLTALTAEHQRDSLRSQVDAAQLEARTGKPDAAVARIGQLLAANPADVHVALNAVAIECRARGRLSADTLARAATALETAAHWNFGLYAWFRDAAATPTTRECAGFGLQGLATMLDAAEANPRHGGSRRRDLWHARGQVALAAGQPTVALRWFDAALALEPSADYALVQAAALGNAGAQRLGVAHLEGYRRLEREQPIRLRDMRSLHEWLLRHRGYHRDEIDTLQRRLREDARADAPAGAGP